MHVPSDLLPTHLRQLEAGTAQRSDGKTVMDLDVVGMIQVIETGDVAAALQAMKPATALYVGGMGANDKNFHKDAMVARGFLLRRPNAFRGFTLPDARMRPPQPLPMPTLMTARWSARRSGLPNASRLAVMPGSLPCA
jgi:hypothetical protein